jgi:D-alanine transaminase
MNTAYLNGHYMPITEAKISPLDRGFLFGDGVYELIPSYNGNMVGFKPHIDRMKSGLATLEIALNWSHDDWQGLCQHLIQVNGSNNLGVYLQVTRGADTKRHHTYPKGITPTVFAMTTVIPPAPIPSRDQVQPYRVSSMRDMRWQRCNIKSISLLGNVMHYQYGHQQGSDEVLLYNHDDELTECGACNAFIVKNSVVITPPLDQQILPGITRQIVLDVLHKNGAIRVEERVVTMDEVRAADEIWISSSSKEAGIAPVTHLDNHPVGDGQVGVIWETTAKLYSESKFDY